MIWNREPTLILAVVQALIVLAVSFGLDWTTEQQGTVLAVSAAVMGLITRTQVSPVAKVEPEVPSAETPPL